MSLPKHPIKAKPEPHPSSFLPTDGTVPPTSYLPPIKRIADGTLESLNDSINYLRLIYRPEVRGSRRHNKSHHENRQLEADAMTISQRAHLFNHIRPDPFERAYAIKWLTSLISLLDNNADAPTHVVQDRDNMIQNAASLLAVCAGTSAAGTLVRDFTFAYHSSPQTSSGDESIIPIVVQITDVSLDNSDFGSVGAQTWGSACVLSEMIVEEPQTFGISADQIKTYGLFRILELGAGTGLVGLSVGKILQRIGLHERNRVELVLTDYHPSVLVNLHTNVQNNIRPDLEDNSPVSISIRKLDWSTFTSENTNPPSLVEPFDMILGADIVYEPQHATWVHSCVTRLLRKPLRSTSTHPSDVPQALFHLVMPLRATHKFESGSIESIFVANPNSQERFLQILEKDTLVCDTDTGEEVEYGYFKIGWI